MVTKNFNVCVIIVTYNGINWIDKCLGSLGNSNQQADVYVIDNASTDNTVSYIRTNYPEVKIFEQENNLGFGKANNIGLRIAYQSGNDYFFLLNQDAYVYPDTIGGLVKGISSENSCGILSPLHFSVNPSELDFGFEKYFKEGNEDAFHRFRIHDHREIAFVPFVNAAAWMISRKCLCSVGLFHPLFEHYGEDVNYASRVIYKGFQIGIDTSVSVIHDRNPSKSKLLTDPENSLKRRFLNVLLDPNMSGIHKPLYLFKTFFRLLRLAQGSGDKLKLARLAISFYFVLSKKVRGFDKRHIQVIEFNV